MTSASSERGRAGRRASPLLLGVAVLLLLLIALVGIAIRVFTSPPLAALAPPQAAPALVAAPEAAPAAPVEPPQREPVVLRPSKPQPLSGQARIIDTGAIEIDGRIVRLRGVRGADGAQAEELARWIGGRDVDCWPAIGERHVCEVGGFDLAEVVLFNGGGRATADAPPALRRAERRAREEGRGVWAAEARRLAPDAPRR